MKSENNCSHVSSLLALLQGRVAKSPWLTVPKWIFCNAQSRFPWHNYAKITLPNFSCGSARGTGWVMSTIVDNLFFTKCCTLALRFISGLLSTNRARIILTESKSLIGYLNSRGCLAPISHQRRLVRWKMRSLPSSALHIRMKSHGTILLLVLLTRSM